MRLPPDPMGHRLQDMVDDAVADAPTDVPVDVLGSQIELGAVSVIVGSTSGADAVPSEKGAIDASSVTRFVFVAPRRPDHQLLLSQADDASRI